MIDAKPKRGFDLNSFNGTSRRIYYMASYFPLTLSWRLAGDYEKAVESSNSAEALTRVLYPNVCVGSSGLAQLFLNYH